MYFEYDQLDLPTQQRMNRDSYVKQVTKDMTTDELRQYIRIKVREELGKIEAKRYAEKLQEKIIRIK